MPSRNPRKVWNDRPTVVETEAGVKAVPAAATEEEARGRAMLQKCAQMLSVRRQRVLSIILFFMCVGFFPAGFVVLAIFDDDHAHFSYPFLAGGGVYIIWGVAWLMYVVPPAYWARIAAYPAAAAEAGKLNERRKEVVPTLLINVAMAVLWCVFIFGDLSSRGGEHATLGLRWAAAGLVVATQVLAAGFTCAAIAGASPIILHTESALRTLLAAVTAFADEVEAGLPVGAVEKGLLELRELMAMVRGPVILSLLGFVSFVVWIVACIVVCVIEPAPPAFYVLMSITMFMPLFLVPLTAARIGAQLKRIPVAISVRACSLGGGSNGVGAASTVDVESGAATADVESGAARADAASGAAEEDEHDARTALRLGLLQLHIERLRLGWYVLGMPITSSLLGRARAGIATLLFFVVRSSLDL